MGKDEDPTGILAFNMKSPETSSFNRTNCCTLPKPHHTSQTRVKGLSTLSTARLERSGITPRHHRPEALVPHGIRARAPRTDLEHKVVLTGVRMCQARTTVPCRDGQGVLVIRRRVWRKVVLQVANHLVYGNAVRVQEGVVVAPTTSPKHGKHDTGTRIRA